MSKEDTKTKKENEKETPKGAEKVVSEGKGDGDWQAKYMLLNADFQNFKKRLSKEQASLSKMIKSKLFIDLLAIVDNFDRALGNEFKTECKEGADGFVLIQKELYGFLKKNGVTELSKLDVFDPQLHEALMYVEAEGKKSGEIVEVLQKGYMINDDVLRPAKVSVAR